MSWQIMKRGLAQAGNRTSKTARCSQWWDSKPEWSADASGGENQHDWQLFWVFVSGFGFRAEVGEVLSRSGVSVGAGGGEVANSEKTSALGFL